MRIFREYLWVMFVLAALGIAGCSGGDGADTDVNDVSPAPNDQQSEPSGEPPEEPPVGDDLGDVAGDPEDTDAMNDTDDIGEADDTADTGDDGDADDADDADDAADDDDADDDPPPYDGPAFTVTIEEMESAPPQFAAAFQTTTKTGGWIMSVDGSRFGSGSMTLYVTLERPGADKITSQALVTHRDRHETGTDPIERVELWVNLIRRGETQDEKDYRLAAQATR